MPSCLQKGWQRTRAYNRSLQEWGPQMSTPPRNCLTPSTSPQVGRAGKARPPPCLNFDLSCFATQS